MPSGFMLGSDAGLCVVEDWQREGCHVMNKKRVLMNDSKVRPDLATRIAES
jgi:hypothetical protein